MLLKALVFFGGKGGVGKSTLSCTTALKLSEKDKTLLTSIDPAHSLSGILGMPIGPKVKHVEGQLYALELSAEDLVEGYTERVLSNLGELLPHVKSGLGEYAKYLRRSPTALETAVLDHLLDLTREYPYIVVDSAPTGQMLRLFETAHMVKGWFMFLYKLAKDRERLEAFMGRKDSLLELIGNRKKRIEKLLDLLKEKSLIFAVANEEPLSLQEAEHIEKALEFVKVYKVINRWKSIEGDFIKIPEKKGLYGIQALKDLDVEPITKLIFALSTS
ncbi:MAG: ArsA family ATPase [Aquificaceae bacterium]